MKNFNTLLFFILAMLPFHANAVDQESHSFVADLNIQRIAEAYALDAVDLAKSQFGMQLDWSDASIENVERALVNMHASYVAKTPTPSREQVMLFAKGFGSYVGEVYRRNYGAEWGMTSINGQKFPGLRTKSGNNFWPWGRVVKFITDGDENNVFDCYRELLKK